MHSERQYVQAAFEAGAAGYLLKSTGREELLAAVQKVLDGQIYVSNELSRQWRDLRDPDAIAKSLDLSAREREVLHLIAEGWSGKEIGGLMNISARTVAFHRENIKRKLGVKTLAGLVHNALAKGVM
jgi:DNA-binding NarL/FixJ family response regulator